MNSTQLHYREATRALEESHDPAHNDAEATVHALQGVTHALLACTTAIMRMVEQVTENTDATDDLTNVTYLGPRTEAVATAVGVLHPIPGSHT